MGLGQGPGRQTAPSLHLLSLLAALPRPKGPWSGLLGEYWVQGTMNQWASMERQRGTRELRPAPWCGAQESQGCGLPPLRKKGAQPCEVGQIIRGKAGIGRPISTATPFQHLLPQPRGGRSRGESQGPLQSTSSLSPRPASAVSCPLPPTKTEPCSGHFPTQTPSVTLISMGETLILAFGAWVASQPSSHSHPMSTWAQPL